MIESEVEEGDEVDEESDDGDDLNVESKVSQGEVAEEKATLTHLEKVSRPEARSSINFMKAKLMPTNARNGNDGRKIVFRHEEKYLTQKVRKLIFKKKN